MSGESETSFPLRCLFAGQLRRDFVILPDGKALLDVPGGNVLYAAAGYLVWEAEMPEEIRGQPGLLARVGEDYPQNWLEEFSRRGIDTRGVRVLPEAVDLRSFYLYTDRSTRLYDDPVEHFARLGLPFPKALLGYHQPAPTQDSRTRLSPISLRQGDIPASYLEASSAHLCPLDYLTHNLLPALLSQAGFTTVTIDPSPGYMNPIFWNEIPALVNGLTAFLPSEEELRALFHGRSTDLWEMAEALCAFGCECVVIKRGASGQLVYDSTTHTRWEIPSYPARLFDLTGAGDAFCGGFLAGYRLAYDPMEAALYGNISASLAVEGHGPFYALDALPGLARARLEALREGVRKL